MKDPTSSQILQHTNACQSHPTVLSLTKCIMLHNYNYFAIKLLFCQILICELKHLKFSVVPYYPQGLNMALVCNCTAKP